MKIEIQESTDTFIKFRLKNTLVSYANALRRILISEVPTVTIDLVDILVNNTAFPDEIISQRLGLVPLYTKKGLIYRDECDCTESCDMCSVSLSLDVSNDSDTPLLVTCKDLRVNSEYFSIKSNPIIAKLGKNQSLRVNCKGYKGIGKTHAKWSPVSVVEFKYEELEVDMCVEIVEGFGKPKDILVCGLEILKNKLHSLREDLIR